MKVVSSSVKQRGAVLRWKNYEEDDSDDYVTVWDADFGCTRNVVLFVSIYDVFCDLGLSCRGKSVLAQMWDYRLGLY